VDIHVASLRKKLGDSRRQEIIVTVRGQGCRLAE
jgi:DNA-binding response OmpR family regulator